MGGENTLWGLGGVNICSERFVKLLKSPWGGLYLVA